jgi:hypothetical protein
MIEHMMMMEEEEEEKEEEEEEEKEEEEEEEGVTANGLRRNLACYSDGWPQQLVARDCPPTQSLYIHT